MIAFFFFFFNYDDEKLYNFPTIRKAFYLVCGKKLEVAFYCSMEKFFDRKINRLTYKKILKEKNSPIAKLYEKAYPSKEDAESVFLKFEENIMQTLVLETEYELSELEAEAIVYWVYHVYSTSSERKIITRQAVNAFSNMFEIDNLAFSNNILYVRDKVELNIITSFGDFCNVIDDLEKQNHTFFYRGHANITYQLLPSIMRQYEWKVHENDMYNELRMNCAKDFSSCKSHLDYLVEMQHYGLPTRLLDVTRNPLVALYFACESEEDRTGEIIIFNVKNDEIKYPGSDKVSILASLPLMTWEYKVKLAEWIADSKLTNEDFNKKAVKLLHEVKLEKPAFTNNIQKVDVGSVSFVLSEKKNDRIIKQDGAFIICGLFDEERNPIDRFRFWSNKKIQIMAVTPKGKRDIIKQLDRFSINKATLFPEIEAVANYIKQKY